MATASKSMTTREFSKATGIPAATISKLIREGKLKARKEGKSWMIPPSQLEAKVVQGSESPLKPSKVKKPAKPQAVPTAAKAAEPVRKPAALVRPAEPTVETRPADPPADKTYSVSEFEALTYLTGKGVSEWLKSGKLKGVKTGSGEWRILASNLQVAAVSRLVRK